MALEDRKLWIIFVVAVRGTNFAANKNNKGDACELFVSIYLSMLRTKRNLVRGDFDHRGPAQSVWVADCYFIGNVLALEENQNPTVFERV